MASNAIRISILANASQARAELSKTAAAAEGIGAKFSKFRLPAALALGAIGAGAKSAINAASDLNEEVSKSQQIFGKNAAAINKWADTADVRLGQSKQQAIAAASTFGLIGQKAGLSGTETAKFSTQFAGLASDLASFNNTTPQEAIDAIGAAMRGESEPIRKYGVLLDDATLRARALKLGLIQSTKQALTPQQKALAASKEILAQTTKAQGDFARTSSGAANKSRILAAQMENTKAKLGQALLPAYQAVLQVLSKFASFASEHTGLIKGIVVAVAALSAVVLAASAAQKVYTAGLLIYNGVAKTIQAVTLAWRTAQFLLNIALVANPIGLLVTAIVGLIAIVAVVIAKNDKLRAKLVAVWNAIKNGVTKAVGAVVGFVKAKWPLLLAILTGPIGLAVLAIARHWKAIKTGIVSAFNGIKSTLTTKISEVKDKIASIKDKVLSVFKNAGSWLYNAGKQIIQGLIDGIGAMFGKVKGKLGELTGKLTSWKGPPRRDKRLLFGAGRLIIGGLVDGFDREIPQVQRTLTKLTNNIAGFGAGLDGTLSVDARSALAVSSGKNTLTVELKLTAQQVDQLTRGRQILADIDVAKSAGVRVRAA